MRRLVAPWSEGLRGIDRRAYVVVSLTLLAVGARMSLFTFLGIYFTRDVDIPIALVGLGFLIENLVRGVVAPAMGALSDRVGRKPVLVGAAIATALVLPTFLLVDSALTLFVWSAAAGAAQAGYWPAAMALLLDLSPPERHQTVLSLNYTAISVGYTVGVMPAGYVLALGFDALAIVSAIGFGLIAILGAWAVRGALPSTGGEGRASFLRDLATAPRDPAFLLLAALGICFPLGIGLIAMVTPLYASQTGLDVGTIGFVLALNGPLLALLAVPVNARIARTGPYRYLPLAACFVALCHATLTLGATPLLLASAVMIFTVGELVFSAALPTAVGQLAPRGMRGAYQGSWNFVFSLGIGSALFLSGVVRDAYGWRVTWIAWSIVTLAAGAGLLAARARFRRTADERNAQAAPPA